MFSWPLASTQAGMNDINGWSAGWQGGAASHHTVHNGCLGNIMISDEKKACPLQQYSKHTSTNHVRINGNIECA
jgi:hypothetical protein